MCSKRRPSDDVGGPFLLLVLTISPPLRFGPALYPAAEVALGRQVSEHQRDGSATIQAQIHHRQALLAPHRSVGFLGACAASYSCLQEERHRRTLWHIERAFRTCHTVRTLIEEVISAVAVTEIVKLPRLRSTDSVSYLFLIDEHLDRTKIPSKVTCVRIRLHQLRWCDLCVPLCGGGHPVPEPLLQLEQAHRLLGIEQLRSTSRLVIFPRRSFCGTPALRHNLGIRPRFRKNSPRGLMRCRNKKSTISPVF